MTEPVSLTGLVALYGAFAATVTLGWNLYRDLHDRARLRVVVHLRRIATSDVGANQMFAVAAHIPMEGATERVFVFIDVTNVGRRPVRWVSWGGQYHERVNGKENFIIVPLQLPKMLTEGDSHSEFTPDLVGHIENVKSISIWDASGKEWKLPRRELSKLKQAIHKQTIAA